MKGICFTELFFGIYFVSMIIYAIVYMAFPIMKKREKGKGESIKEVSSVNREPESKVRSIVKMIIGIVILLGIAMIFLWFVYEYRVLKYIFSIISVVFVMLGFGYAMWNFIGYIFLRPYEYKLDEKKNQH